MQPEKQESTEQTNQQFHHAQLWSTQNNSQHVGEWVVMEELLPTASVPGRSVCLQKCISKITDHWTQSNFTASLDSGNLQCTSIFHNTVTNSVPHSDMENVTIVVLYWFSFLCIEVKYCKRNSIWLRTYQKSNFIIHLISEYCDLLHNYRNSKV
jgi:hypothetical protein